MFLFYSILTVYAYEYSVNNYDFFGNQSGENLGIFHLPRPDFPESCSYMLYLLGDGYCISHYWSYQQNGTPGCTSLHMSYSPVDTHSGSLQYTLALKLNPTLNFCIFFLLMLSTVNVLRYNKEKHVA